jgi:hypothetical protein
VPTTAPVLQWNVSSNTLSTLFYDLIEAKIITYTGKTEHGANIEIAKMINQYFISKDKDTFSIRSITDTLQPKTPKAKKRIDIKNIIPASKAIKKR